MRTNTLQIISAKYLGWALLLSILASPGLHDHDAPDPPWGWAVTPETVLSWEGQ